MQPNETQPDNASRRRISPAARAEAAAARMPPTETERRANQIEVATYIGITSRPTPEKPSTPPISQLRDHGGRHRTRGRRPEQALATIPTTSGTTWLGSTPTSPARWIAPTPRSAR